MSTDLNTSKWNITGESVLMPELVDLQKFMFRDRHHLTGSAFTRVCPSMTGLVLWITTFNCCRTSLLLLLLNVFLKVREVYFKADSLVSGPLERSECSAGAPPNCTSSTINFVGVEDPFSDEVSAFMAVWHNCCLAGCVGAFSQLLKCFSNISVPVMVLPQCGHSSFLMEGSQWCC